MGSLFKYLWGFVWGLLSPLLTKQDERRQGAEEEQLQEGLVHAQAEIAMLEKHEDNKDTAAGGKLDGVLDLKDPGVPQ